MVESAVVGLESDLHNGTKQDIEVPADASVVRQKFHDTRWRGSFGGALGIGPRLGSQRLGIDLVLTVADGKTGEVLV